MCDYQKSEDMGGQDHDLSVIDGAAPQQDALQMQEGSQTTRTPSTVFSVYSHRFYADPEDPGNSNEFILKGPEARWVFDLIRSGPHHARSTYIWAELSSEDLHWLTAEVLLDAPESLLAPILDVLRRSTALLKDGMFCEVSC